MDELVDGFRLAGDGYEARRRRRARAAPRRIASESIDGSTAVVEQPPLSAPFASVRSGVAPAPVMSTMTDASTVEPASVVVFGHAQAPVWHVAPLVQAVFEHGVPSASVDPTHSPTALHTSFCMQLLPVEQAVPGEAFTSLQSPVPESQVATRHCPDGAQTFGVPMQSPAEHVVASRHLSVGEQLVPLAIVSVVHAPVSASQSPVLHGGISVVQSSGEPQSHMPALHVPGVAQQPVVPHAAPPVRGVD